MFNAREYTQENNIKVQVVEVPTCTCCGDQLYREEEELGLCNDCLLFGWDNGEELENVWEDDFELGEEELKYLQNA